MLPAHRRELAQSWTCHFIWLKILASDESKAVLIPSIHSRLHQVHRDAQARVPETSTSRSWRRLQRWQAVQPTGYLTSLDRITWFTVALLVFPSVSTPLDRTEQFPISGLSLQGQTNTEAEDKVGWRGLTRRASLSGSTRSLQHSLRVGPAHTAPKQLYPTARLHLSPMLSES